MPEIIPNVDDIANPVSPPMPRSALFFDGTNWQVARVSATGYLEIDVLTSALPAGAATEATLASADAYLALITLLRNALQSVDTDRLIVRGEDQVFSYQKPLQNVSSGNPSGANGWRESGTVPPGQVWVVTTVAARDRTTALTAIRFMSRRAGVSYDFGGAFRAIAADEFVYWSGHVYLNPTDEIRAYYTGCLAGDTVDIDITGYIMTLET